MDELIQQLRGRFFEEWQSGQKPDMAVFLKQIDREHRGVLLKALIKVDVVMRRRYGKPASETTYQRFGDAAAEYAQKQMAAADATESERSKSKVVKCGNCGASVTLLPDRTCPQCGPQLSTVAPSQSPALDKTVIRPVDPATDGDPSLTETYIVSRKGVHQHVVEDADITELLSIGEMLNGRYRLDSRIGKGGMGVVFAGTDTRLERPVAIKFILVHRLSNDPARMKSEFEQEAKLGASLRHQSIATVHDYGIHSGVPYCIFEYVAGKSLKDLIAKRAPMAQDDVLQFCGQLAMALDYAHSKGIVHRDLKPDNLRFDEHQQLRILDFGLAKRFASHEDWSFAGTPAYASPEQANEVASDGRTDQYALALITYEMLTGKRPFSNRDWRALLESHRSETPPTPSSISRNIPRAIDKAILKALSKNPEARYRTCSEFAAAMGCSITTTARKAQQLILESGAYEKLPMRRSFTVARLPRVFLGLTSDSFWLISNDATLRISRTQYIRVKAKRKNLAVTVKTAPKKTITRVFKLRDAKLAKAWAAEFQESPKRQPTDDNQDFVIPNDPVVILKGAPGTKLRLLESIEARQTSAADAELELRLRAAMLGANVVINYEQSKEVQASGTLSVATGNAAISVGTAAKNHIEHNRNGSECKKLATGMLLLLGAAFILRMLGSIIFGGIGVTSYPMQTLILSVLYLASVPVLLATLLWLTRWPQFLRPAATANLTSSLTGMLAGVVGLMTLKDGDRTTAFFSITSLIDPVSIAFVAVGVILTRKSFSLYKRYAQLPVDVFEEGRATVQGRRKLTAGIAWSLSMIYGLCVVLSIIFPAWNSAGERQLEIAALMASGDPAKVASAKQKLIDAAKESPNDDQLFISLSYVRLVTKDYAGALESATKAVEIRPSKDAYLNRSSAFLNLNQPMDALEDADRAFAIDSGDGKAALNRSIALCMMNRVEESFAAFDDAVKQSAEPSLFINDFYDVLVAEGTKKVGVQRLQEAVQILDKAVSLRPDVSSAYAWRATAKVDQRLLDDALADSETALRITPGMPLAHFIRGIVRLQSGSFEESVADLTVAINGDFSTSPLAHQFRGLALQQLGRGEEAARDLATFQRLQQATQAAPTP